LLDLGGVRAGGGEELRCDRGRVGVGCAHRRGSFVGGRLVTPAYRKQPLRCFVNHTSPRNHAPSACRKGAAPIAIPPLNPPLISWLTPLDARCDLWNTERRGEQP
jgi:hypothetical protein